VSALLAFLAPTLVGVALVARLAGRASGSRAEAALLLTTGLALGAALVSTSHAALLLLGGSREAARSTPKDLAFAAVGALAAGSLVRRRGRAAPTLSPAGTRDPLLPPLVAAAAVAFAAAIAVVVLRSVAMPDGEWDAYGFWNLRARLLVQDVVDPTVVFSTDTPHPDYPLLLPGLTATGWLYAGDRARWVPAAVAVFWTVLCGVGVFAGAARIRGARAACLSVLLLFAAPHVAKVASWQYADVPTATLLLLSISWLAVAHAGPREAAGRGLALAGLCAGLAAWTKNEGLAQALVVGLAVLAVPPAGASRTRAFSAFAAGALPFLALSVAFKASIDATNDLVAGASPARLLDRAGDVSRYVEIARSFAAELLHSSRWNFLFPLALLSLAALSPIGPPTMRRALGGVLLLLAATYFAVYVLTPRDLAWHLNSSLHRLMLHAWPSLVLFVVTTRGVPRFRRRQAG
jgi:hypothetical protein